MCKQLTCHITVGKVRRLRKRLEPGEKVRFQEPVLYNDRNGSHAHGKHQQVEGIVIRKFPWLAQVRKQDGKLTTVTYVDLLLGKKRL